MHQILFRRGSAPDPAEGAYSTPPDPLAEFKGPTSKGREEREGKGKGVEGKEGKGRRGNVAFHHLLLSNLTTGWSRSFCRLYALPVTQPTCQCTEGTVNGKS